MKIKVNKTNAPVDVIRCKFSNITAIRQSPEANYYNYNTDISLNEVEITFDYLYELDELDYLIKMLKELITYSEKGELNGR